MSIFNSLGSNYDTSTTIKSLFVWPSRAAGRQLEIFLGEYYTGKASLTFKAREALELAFLNSNLPKGSVVGISGFTCYVVYEAVKNAGYKPVFIDIVRYQTQYSVEQLKHAHERNKDLAAIVVQNTFGQPADMVEIEAYCLDNKIMIVEDLAHSLGAVYADGREVGRVGSFTILSFSQDKPLDVVAGGALIDRRPQVGETKFKARSVSLWQRLKVRFYPFWTGLIRNSYDVGIGRPLHFALKKTKLMATPMNDSIKGIHKISGSTARLVLSKWSNRQVEIAHRRAIAKIYQDNIPLEFQITHTSGQPVHLRYPLVVENRESLVDYLREHKIYIGDTWYDAPIGPKQYLARTDYKLGACPAAEYLVARIVNLPTHRQVTPEIANDICAKIKQWQTSH